MSDSAPTSVTDGGAVADGNPSDQVFGPVNDDSTSGHPTSEDPPVGRGKRRTHFPPDGAAGDAGPTANGRGGRRDGRHEEVSRDPQTPTSEGGGRGGRRDGRDNEIASDPPTHPTSVGDPAASGGGGRRNDGRHNEVQRDPRMPTSEDPPERRRRDGGGRDRDGFTDATAEAGGGRRNDGRHHDIQSDPQPPTSEEDPDRRSQRDKRRPPEPTSEGGGSRGRDGRDNEIAGDPPVQADALTELLEDAYWHAPQARADRAGRLGGIQALPDEAHDVVACLAHRPQPTA